MQISGHVYPETETKNVVGFIKGECAISVARTFLGKDKNISKENIFRQDASLFR